MSFNVHIETLELDDFDFSERELAAYPSDQAGDVEMTGIGSVDLMQIHGCWHQKYEGKTFGELVPRAHGDGDETEKRILGALKRGPDRLAYLHRNPSYYIGEEVKTPPWSFEWIDGRLYITAGMHRSVIGLYFLAANGLSTVVHGVTVTHMRGTGSAPVEPSAPNDASTPTQSAQSSWAARLSAALGRTRRDR